MGGISIWQLLIILVIVALLFGTSKLRNIGKDVGGAVKGFKDAMRDEETKQPQERLESEKPEEPAEKAQAESAQTKEKQH